MSVVRRLGQGALLSAAIFFVASIGSPAHASCNAAGYTLVTANPTVNWSDPTIWTGGGGQGYPGHCTDDSVAISGYSGTLDVDVSTSPIGFVSIACTCTVEIQSGVTMQFESGGGFSGAGSVKIDGGGTFKALSGTVLQF